MKYLALTLLLSLTGCSSWNFNDGDIGAAERFGITVATMKYVESEVTPEDRKARAERVIKVANEAKSFLNTGTASLDLLQSAVLQRLPADLSPSDRMLAAVLIQVVTEELKARVGAGIIPPNQMYQVSAVLGIVISAAESYRGVS